MSRRTENQNPPDFIGRPVWAEVSLSALTGNLRAIRDYVNPAGEKRKNPAKGSLHRKRERLRTRRSVCRQGPRKGRFRLVRRSFRR